MTDALHRGQHVALLCWWEGSKVWRYTQFAWRIIDIDPDDPRHVRIENCRGGTLIVTNDQPDGHQPRLKPLDHLDWIVEPDWATDLSVFAALNKRKEDYHDSET